MSKNLLDYFSGLVHLWGKPGSGKTLLAVALAAHIAKGKHVLWVNTDGKGSFLQPLRRNILEVGGKRENVSVVLGHKRARETIEDIPELIRSDTRLVIIDPITRVLDMGFKNTMMWGRELFEESLPVLASLTLERNICILILNEVRQFDSDTLPIHYEIMKRYCDSDYQIRRIITSNTSEILNSQGKFAELNLLDEGIVRLLINPNFVEGDSSCLEGPVSV